MTNQERDRAEAEAYAKKTSISYRNGSPLGEVNGDVIDPDMYDAYLAGLEAERKRGEKLREALEHLVAMVEAHQCGHTIENLMRKCAYREAIEALAEYEGKADGE